MSLRDSLDGCGVDGEIESDNRRSVGGGGASEIDRLFGLKDLLKLKLMMLN